MREVFFLKQNRDKWRAFEQKLEHPELADPDEVAELFIHVNDDLSYARTFYPRSNTVRYLNQLAGKVYLNIYKNKREPFRRIWDFWAKEIPQEVIHAKYAFLIATLIFLIMTAAGVLSTLKDEHFAVDFFGASYVSTTQENIRSGNPTGVYQDSEMMDMFWQIAYNNIWVDLNTFIYGIFLGLGTVYLLIQNGVMVGTFFTMFYQENVHAEAWRIIMIHGTIELSTIIISGAAGLCLGFGILFPGTYNRKTALMNGAKRGLKIMLGVIPFTVIAAILESFVTRYANMPLIVNLAIILFSVILMFGYWLVYPLYLHQRRKKGL